MKSIALMIGLSIFVDRWMIAGLVLEKLFVEYVLDRIVTKNELKGNIKRQIVSIFGISLISLIDKYHISS